MPLAAAWRRTLVRSSVNRTIQSLENAPPVAVESLGPRIVRTFQRAAGRVPAYRRWLADQKVNVDQVVKLDDFRTHVPIIDKINLFGEHRLAEVCIDGQLEGVSTIYCSSGYSGKYAWGVETAGDENQLRRRLDFILHLHFDVADRATLVINALPAGVRVPVGLASCIDTGTRVEAILAAMRTVAVDFEQTLLIAEPPLLKRIVEDGIAQGIDWRRLTVHLITGGGIMPENLRRYLDALLGHDASDPGGGFTLISLGVSELGLSLGQETRACRRLRAALLEDEALRQALWNDCPFLPTLVQYFPQQYFIETPVLDGLPRLVATTLDLSRRIPLVRYTTNDWALDMPYASLAEALRGAGREDLVPNLHLPLLAVWGRGRGLDVEGKQVFPEQVRDALYCDHEAAAATTANFHMNGDERRLHVRFQLKPGIESSDALTERFRRTVAGGVGLEPSIELVPYERFEIGMELSYQRKFQYL